MRHPILDIRLLPLGVRGFLAGLVEHRCRPVDSDNPGLRPALPQDRRDHAGATTEIDDFSWGLDGKVGQEIERGAKAQITKFQVQSRIPAQTLNPLAGVSIACQYLPYRRDPHSGSR